MKRHVLVQKGAEYRVYRIKPEVDLDQMRRKYPDLTIRECDAPPTTEELEEMLDVALATDGCRVEPDGYCPHGCPSWMIVLGLI